MAPYVSQGFYSTVGTQRNNPVTVKSDKYSNRRMNTQFLKKKPLNINN